MSKKKIMLTQLMAASLMAAYSNDRGPHYSGYQAFAQREFKCGLCKNFPNGTFCKLAGHRVSRFTPAYKCDKFEFNDNKTEK